MSPVATWHRLGMLVAFGCLIAFALLIAHQPLFGSFLAVGVAVIVFAIAFHVRFGLTLLWPLGAVALLQPWNGLRPISGATYGDIAIFASVGFCLLTLPTARVRKRLLIPLIGTLIVLASGIFGMLATASDVDRSLQTPADVAQLWVPVTLLGANGAVSQLLKFTLAVPLMLVLFMVLNPNRRTAIYLSRMFAIGCGVNGAASLGGFGIQSELSTLMGRASGFANLATHLSLTGVLGFGVAIGWAVAAHHWTSRWFAILIAFLCVSSVVLSGTRSAFIACAVVAVFFAILGRLRGLIWFAGTCAVSVVLVAAVYGFLPPENAINRLLGGGRFDSASVIYSNQDHLNLLERSLHEIGTHPFTGTGFFSGLLAHNMVVMAANIGGPLALLGIAITFGSILTAVAVALVKGVPPGQWDTIGPLGGVLGFIAFGQFQNIFWDRYIWFFICVALLCLPDFFAKKEASAAVEDEVATSRHSVDARVDALVA